MKNKDLKKLKKIFWDYKWNSVLKNLNSPFVIARVLEIGDVEQVKLFLKFVDENKIKEFLKNYGKKLLSDVSYNFWYVYYENKIG